MLSIAQFSQLSLKSCDSIRGIARKAFPEFLDLGGLHEIWPLIFVYSLDVLTVKTINTPVHGQYPLRQ